MLINDVCQECTDTKDAKLTNLAWELVDEGNTQYTFTLTYNKVQPSGHDWTDREGEFMPPIVHLEDGMNEELAMHLGALWELDDSRQRAREIECNWCHILTQKLYNDCQLCDTPLEHHVR
jgi:hypothetical protein